ncbi:MAG: DUF1259 domain-containing protein [Burkholderiales bacterium]|nr:DUF1259 domain-containing protein [Burkholderiales bacterium]
MLNLRFVTRGTFTVLLAICSLSAVAAGDPQRLDAASIEQLTGLHGTYSSTENVFKVSSPRNDVTFRVDNWDMPTFMGLTSWAAFTPAHDGRVMMMGDTVLLEDEVNPAMSAALDAGLEVTALHNHFFFDKPKVFFMHVGGTGNINQLAGGIRKVYDRISEIRAAAPIPAAGFAGQIPATNAITPAPLEAVFQAKGQTSNGMFKVVIGRPGSMHGVAVANEMGINTWAAFAGNDDNAVVDGDFAMFENELQPVLKAMRAGGINIVAIHQHMAGEQPRYLFLHYWGKGRAVDLAKTIQQALAVQSIASNQHH